MDLHVTLAGAPPTAFASREIVVDTDALPTGAALADRLASSGYQGPFTVDGRPLTALLPHSGDFPHGAVIVCGAPPGPGAAASLPHLAFVVHTGPDAGQVVPLTRGSYVIGRAADIAIADPALSRHHALLTVTEDSVLLEDLGSGNGTFVDGARITTADITSAAELRVGGSLCRLGLIDDPEWTAGDLRGVLEPLTVIAELPGRPSRVLVLTALLPLVLGVLLALTTGLWFFLAFSALSAVTGLVPLMTYRRKAAVFADEVRDAAGRDRARRGSVTPDPGRTGLDAVRASHRPPPGAARAARPEPDLVLLRLGTADQPANLAVSRAGSPFEPPMLAAIPLLLPCSRAAGAGDAPSTGPFTITGDAARVHGVLRALLLQTAHPRAAAPTLVCWGSARDLPHHARFLPNVHLTHDPAVLASLAAQSVLLLVFQLSEDLPALTGTAGVLVVRFTAGSPPDRPVSGPEAGPEEPGMTLTAGTAWAHLGGHAYEVRPDGVSERTFERTARALARAAALDPASPEAGRRTRAGTASVLPASTSLWSEDLLPDTLASTVADRWSTSDGGHATARVGRSGDGPLSIDLVTDGPHLLVAGTTGSGKSEFLRTLVLGLALAQPPEHLTLLLVDYKGGSGLGPLASLPHCVGALTDLSSESTGRALTSLRAELLRRERLCSEYDAQDLDALRRVAAAACPPRLVIVIDEFRRLGDDVPTAIPDLMTIAALGRSLGVHLVLATQRAQGAVTPDMRANITSSVLLRVQTPMESQDLLGTSAAADLSVDTPGRAFLRRGSEAPIPFQVASSSVAPAVDHRAGWQDVARYIGGPPAGGPSGVAAPEAEEEARQQPTPCVLETAVGALRSAAGGDSALRPRRPVLPPLPAVLTATACDAFPPATDGDVPAAGPGRGVALGVADFPDRQDQRLLLWRPQEHSHLAFVGLPGSGAGRALAAVAGRLPIVDPDVHLYLLDGDGSLTGCSARPQVGAFVRSEETRRAGRVLERLAGLPGGRPDDGPRIVLVVTGWGRWSSQFRQGRVARAEDDLQSLVRDGSARGVTVCIGGDRELTSARFFALLPNRVYVPLGAQQETTMTWPRMPPMDAVAGRGFAQGRVTGIRGEGPCQLVQDDPLPGLPMTPPARAPFPVHPLPPTVDVARLHRGSRATRRRGSIDLPLGLGGDDLEPYAISLRPGEVFLVLGHPKAGRTTAIRVLRDSASRLRPHPVVVAPPDGGAGAESLSYWRDLGERGVGPSAQDCLMLVDDADRLPADVHQVLAGLIAHGAAAVLTAAPGPSLMTRVPLAVNVRGLGRGLVLGPRSPGDGDFLGVRLEPEGSPPPGRGFACDPWGALEIQVAQGPVDDDRRITREQDPAVPRGNLQRSSRPRRPGREIDDGLREEGEDHRRGRCDEQEADDRIPGREEREGQDHQEQLDHEGGRPRPAEAGHQLPRHRHQACGDQQEQHGHEDRSPDGDRVRPEDRQEGADRQGEECDRLEHQDCGDQDDAGRAGSPLRGWIGGHSRTLPDPPITAGDARSRHRCDKPLTRRAN